MPYSYILLQTVVGYACSVCDQKGGGGMTMVPNDKNELVSMRSVTGCRVCMDYRKLNALIEKDHFPMPFMDQMLDLLRINRGMFLKYGTLNGRIIGRRSRVLLSGKNLRKIFLVSTFPL